jgi:hypothetical protein
VWDLPLGDCCCCWGGSLEGVLDHFHGADRLLMVVGEGRGAANRQIEVQFQVGIVF